MQRRDGKAWLLLVGVVVCGVAVAYAAVRFFGSDGAPDSTLADLGDVTQDPQTPLPKSTTPVIEPTPASPTPQAPPSEPPLVPPEPPLLPPEPPPEPPVVPPEPPTLPTEPPLTPPDPPSVLPQPQGPIPATVQAAKQEALGVAEQILAAFPDNVPVIGLIGTVYDRHFEADKAIACWRKCLTLDDRCGDAYLALGRNAFKDGEYQEAADLLRKASELSPRLKEVYMLYGGALVELGQPAEAIAAFEREAEISPQNGKNLFQLGRAYLQLKDYANAVDAYQRALQLAPNESSTYYALVTAYTRWGRQDLAAEYRERFQTLRAAEDAAVVDGRGKQDDLAAALRRLAKTHVDAGGVYRMLRDGPRAEHHWQRAAALDAGNAACRQQLVVFYTQQQRDAQAARACGELTKIDQNNADYRLKFGSLLARLGQLDAAETQLRKAAALAPKRAAAYRALVQVLLLGDRQPSDAPQLAETLVGLEATAANHALLATVRQRVGDRAGALAAIERAVELDPANDAYRRTRDTLQLRN